MVNEPTITAKEMAEKVGVTDRTIRREIDTLKTLGVNITRVGGKTHGHWEIQQ